MVKQGVLRTPSMPSGAPSPPSHKHADDTKLNVLNLESDGPVALSAVDAYCAASNAQLNRQKSKGVVMGSHAPVVGLHEATGITFPAADEPPKLLGLAFTTNLALAAQCNFPARKKSLLAAKHAWLKQALTFYGRAHVAKQVMASAFLYHWSVQPPNAEELDFVEQTIQDFLLKAPHPSDGTCRTMHPRLPYATLPWADGGMSLTDLRVLLKCMQAKFVALVFAPGVQPWKELFRHALAKAAPLGAGPDFVLRHVTCAPLADLLPRVQVMAQAFRETEPHKLVPPAALPHEAIMREPLYFNPAAVAGGMQQPDLALWALLLPGGGVPRVQHLRDALQQLQLPAPDSPINPGFVGPVPQPRPPASIKAYCHTIQQYMQAQPQLPQPHHHPPLLPPNPAPPPLPPDVALSHVQQLIQTLPPAWQEAVETVVPPAPEWLVHSLIPWLVTVNLYISSPQHGSGYYAAQGNGRMLPISEDAALAAMTDSRGGTWLPACVMLCAKPKHLWTAEDHQQVEAAAALSQSEAGEEVKPTEHRLLAPWPEVALWPAAWGHGSTPLHEFCVKTTRVRCFQLRAITVDSNYTVGRGLSPSIWEPDSQPQPADMEAEDTLSPSARLHQPLSHQSSLSGCQRTGLGLQALERRWEADIRRRSQPSRPASSKFAGPEVDSPAMRVSQPREHPLKRAADRQLEAAMAAVEQAAEASDQHTAAAMDVWSPIPGDSDRAAADTSEPSEFKRAWKRIGESSMPKGQRGIAFRIMHGVLACRAFVAARRVGDKRLQPACCQAPQCLASVTMESLSHLFIHCPSVRPALDWLLSTWQAISGKQLLPDPAIILADDPAAWPAGCKPEPDLHSLWTRLRLAFLYFTWLARSSLQHDGPGEHAAAIAAAVVRNISDQLRSDWLRVTSDIRNSTSVCGSWFRGRDPAMEVAAFEERWAHRNVLCQCLHGNLVVHLSNTTPIPIPTACAVGAGAGQQPAS